MTTRGAIAAAGRVFSVYGSSLCELAADGTNTIRGALLTSTGRVGMAWGTTQLVITDGAHGYVFNLNTNAFAQITDPDFPGSRMVSYLDGYFIFQNPATQQFYTTLIDDASNIDALDFASAQSTPDNIVAHTVINRELLLLGDLTTEWWFASGGADFPLDRRTVGAFGCVSPWTVKRADNAVLMIGRDENGAGLVYLISGYQAKRVSTSAIEAELQGSTDIAASTAYVWQWRGETFYAINAPGLKTTLVYQMSTGTWCEMADLDDVGQYKQFRAVDHVYAYGQNLIFEGGGKVWALDGDVHTYGGDPRVCERTSPHNATPMRDRVPYSEFVLDCTTGAAPIGEEPMVELSWSNDGGEDFGDPVLRSAGLTGQRHTRLVWRRLGMARDRVWRVRCSGNTRFSIVSAETR
jgi:hypothetical protein